MVAIRPSGASRSGDKKWLFQCDCGVEFECNGYYARIGKVTSCPQCSRVRVSKASIKHGMSGTPEFSVWTDIQTRCSNANRPEYPGYGGRGIRVCDRWLQSFDNFYADMGPRPSNEHSIDRIDVNGNYEPGNCRWATREQQARNKRSNHYITIDGVTKTMQEWANQAGISASAILLRERSGISGPALLAPSTRGGTITFNGVTDTYAGWSGRTGIKQSTIAMRLNSYGWTIERALTKGASL